VAWLAFGWAIAQPAAGPSTGAASQPSAEAVLRIEAGMHTAPIARIDVDAAGRWAVTAGPDKTARVWEADSGRLAQVLRPPIGAGDEGKLQAVAIAPDASVVAVGGNTGFSWNRHHQVYVFERASGRMLQRLGGLPAPPLDLAFSPDGRWLAAALGGRAGLRIWDWRRPGPPLVDADYRAASLHVAWSRDGCVVTSASDGLLRLYALEGGSLRRVAAQKAPGGQLPRMASFAPDGDRIAVGYEDTARIDLLDGRTLAPLGPLTAPASPGAHLRSVAWSADGQRLVGAGLHSLTGPNFFHRWPAGGAGAPQTSRGGFYTVYRIVPLPRDGWLFAASNPMWGRLAEDGTWRPLGVPPIADMRYSRGTAFQLADGGRTVQFGYLPRGQVPYQFDLPSRTLRPGPLPQGQPPAVAGLEVEDWEDLPTPRIAGKPLPLLPGEVAHGLAVAPDAGGFVLATDFRLRRYAADGAPVWAQAVPAAAWGVNVPREGPQAGRLVLATYGDGTIRWHRWSDGRELLALFAHADRRRWILWTPSGYYDASPGAEELLGWHINRGQDDAADFFPASRLRGRFYRPDVIDRVLDTLDEAEALRQAGEVSARRSEAAPAPLVQTLPPVVELLSAAEIGATEPRVTVRVRARSATDAPVSAWRVRVDGQARPGARGATPLAEPDVSELAVDVPPHDSEIQVFAENRHGISAPTVVRVRWLGAAAGGAGRQPRLYVLAVGVGRYGHPDLRPLAFAAKDAQDFAAAMSRQKGRLYGEVEVRLLTDAQATRDEVVDGLDWLQKQVTQHDVGMLFFAGHGINDPALGYTFLPANADPERLKRTGVTMADIRSTLANVAGKAVFFFDTCHAGNVLGAGRRGLPNDISGVVNELAGTENGVVVFSSSTGRQFSYEDPAWRNGAFTRALVEGLDGAAAQGGSTRITYKMLDFYVSDRVKALTAGRQTPVTQAPGGVPDFPVAVK
jgi:hypothetical protein